MPNSVRVRRIVGLGAGRATWSTFNVTLADGRNGIEPYSFEIRSDRGARKKIYYGRPPSVVSMGLSRIRVVVDSLEDDPAFRGAHLHSRERDAPASQGGMGGAR